MRGVLIGVTLVVGACKDQAGDVEDGGPVVPNDLTSACTSASIALDVGTGQEGYVPLEDGDTVTMVHGPQGGWHVESAGLVANSATDVTILPRIRSESLGIDITGTQQTEFVGLVDYDDGSCAGVFYGIRAFVETDRPSGPSGLAFVCGLEGETVTLSIAVGDLGDEGEPVRETTNEVDVILALDPKDVPDCQ